MRNEKFSVLRSCFLPTLVGKQFRSISIFAEINLVFFVRSTLQCFNFVWIFFGRFFSELVFTFTAISFKFRSRITLTDELSAHTNIPFISHSHIRCSLKLEQKLIVITDRNHHFSYRLERSINKSSSSSLCLDSRISMLCFFIAVARLLH